MIRRSRLMAMLAVGALTIAACGSDNESDDTGTPGTTEAPSATDGPDTTEPSSSDGWTINTDDCIDPDLVDEPIEGSISIGTVLPLSGTPAILFAPVANGMKAYVDYANENGLLGDTTIELSIEDDQYNAASTPAAVEKLLDKGVDMFAGIIGTPNNLAVRDLLNEECYPQLLALTGSTYWGEVSEYPWTTGALTPYPVEVQGYLNQMRTLFPDGGTLGVFTVNSEFGAEYAEAAREYAAEYGFEIVVEQTIEASESNPPQAQVSALARAKPDAILAVPLGLQCGVFLAELANAKAATPGWEPPTFITATCASQLLLAGAGDAATGVYTAASAGLADIGNPEVQTSDPRFQEYVDYMTSKGFGDVVTTGGAGWNVMEVTVAILKQAQESADGLTRASIINAARNFTYTPKLAREGVEYRMSGEDDPYQAEAIQIVQYDAGRLVFDSVGDLVLDYESS
jgi:branched-chain amino acid transport system substrate-binding protein